jgi:hypothetical protein
VDLEVEHLLARGSATMPFVRSLTSLLALLLITTVAAPIPVSAHGRGDVTTHLELGYSEGIPEPGAGFTIYAMLRDHADAVGDVRFEEFKEGEVARATPVI